MTRPAEAFARAAAMAAAGGDSTPGGGMAPEAAQTGRRGVATAEGCTDAPAAVQAAPRRIQRRRARGWRLPPGCVCVDRSTRWGNPFVVGRDGTAAECVHHYAAMLAGSFCVSPHVEFDELRAARAHVLAHGHELRGRDLACWCGESAKWCHADVLLAVVNQPPAVPKPDGDA